MNVMEKISMSSVMKIRFGCTRLVLHHYSCTIVIINGTRLYRKCITKNQFMWLFGRVERLQQRLRVMIFIGNFNENVRTIGPQLKAVISASMSIRNSEKLKKILEIILAFGNYMNSGKRGSVYGFKLTSLEALVETKSTDKSQNLLHYICNVVHSYFSDVADFMCEIRYVDQGIVQSIKDSIIFRFHEPPTPAGQGPCGINKGP